MQSCKIVLIAAVLFVGPAFCKEKPLCGMVEKIPSISALNATVGSLLSSMPKSVCAPEEFKNIENCPAVTTMTIYSLLNSYCKDTLNETLKSCSVLSSTTPVTPSTDKMGDILGKLYKAITCIMASIPTSTPVPT